MDFYITADPLILSPQQFQSSMIIRQSNQKSERALGNGSCNLCDVGQDLEMHISGKSDPDRDLYLAARTGRTDLLEKAIKLGVDVDQLFHDDTAIAHAIFRGHAEIVSQLMEHGASVSVTDGDGKNSAARSLRDARESGNCLDVIRVLENSAPGLVAPLIVKGFDLDPRAFDCCKSSLLRPIKCIDCSHLMVLCMHCHKYFNDLNDTSVSREMSVVGDEYFREYEFGCPNCGRLNLDHEYFDMESYVITKKTWIELGFRDLLLK